MKLLLVFVAILGLAAADDLSDLKTFLKCLDKAITVGIPSIGVPPHEPLHIEDFVVFEGASVAGLNFSLTNNILHGLLNYTFPTLEVAKTTSSPDTVTYKYAIYWPQLTFTGNWGFYFQAFLEKIGFHGDYNIVLKHLTWSGIFNLTKPGQKAYPETVNEFTLTSEVKGVDVHIKGLGLFNLALEGVLKTALNILFNHFPAEAAEGLRTARFNEFWISHPEKIQAVMQFCGLKN